MPISNQETEVNKSVNYHLNTSKQNVLCQDRVHLTFTIKNAFLK